MIFWLQYRKLRGRAFAKFSNSFVTYSFKRMLVIIFKRKIDLDVFYFIYTVHISSCGEYNYFHQMDYFGFPCEE